MMPWTITGGAGGEVAASCGGVDMRFAGPLALALAAATAAVLALGGVDGSRSDDVGAAAHSSGAERTRRCRQRAALAVREGVTEAGESVTGGVTCNGESVTESVTCNGESVTGGVASGVASASQSGSLPSLPSAFSSSPRERARSGERGEGVTCNGAAALHVTAAGVARDVTGLAAVDLDMAVPVWAGPRVEAMRISCGPRELEIGLVWRGYLANVAKWRAAGRAEAVDVAGWSAWLVKEWKLGPGAGGGARRGPVVQRDPPGPKAYAVGDGRALLADQDERTAQ